MQKIIDDLNQLRTRSRMLLLLQRSALIVSVVLAAIMVLIGLDFLVRLPAGFRWVVLLLGIAGLVAACVVYLWSAWKYHPTTTQLALRVEQAFPQLRGRLASSVEFAESKTDETNSLAGRSIRETESRMSGASVHDVIRMKSTWRNVGWFAGVLGAIVLFAIVSPTVVGTGLQRVLWPSGNAAWPARTGVESLMTQVVSPARVYSREQALPLRARVTKGPQDQEVEVVYRLQIDGSYDRWQKILLTHQAGGVQERLFEADAEAIEFYFETDDFRTDDERIELIEPPTVLSAALRVTPPEYAREHMPPLEADMGSGIDDRSVTRTPSLIGSMAEMQFVLNKPLPIPETEAEKETWLRQALGWDGGDLPDMYVAPDTPALWQLQWPLTQTRTMTITLRDQYGLENSEPITYRIDAEPDRSPNVIITEPQRDEVVLANALVPLESEAKDDVALRWLELRATVQKGVSDQSAEGGVAAEPDDGEPEWAERIEEVTTAAELDVELDLSQFDLKQGDAVIVVAAAQDGYDIDGVTHDPVLSAARRLQVISELDYATQLRRQLSAVRQNAIRIESMQSEVQDDVIDDGLQPGVDRAQAQISQRVADQREAVEQLRKDLQRNRLDDPQLQELLNQTADMLDFAGRASNEAAAAIDERAQQGGQESNGEGEEASEDEQESDPLLREPDEEDRPIVEAQQEVREELADLIELLDRDEDTWIITRQLEDLIKKQAELEAETAEISQRTIGQSRDELAEDDRTALDKIAQRQRELKEEAQKLIEEMRDRAEAMEDIDPGASAGMRNAAETGEQRELDRDMERAAEQAQQNQLQTAQASQQAARETLERQREEMEETRRAKAEQLLRQLASLIESIERLITVQENELSALALAQEQDNFTGRDRAMIRLNQNTSSVEGEARAAGQDARRVARALDRAADAQGAAIVALRNNPVLAADAEEAENRSLELLNEAKSLAEELEKQTQEDQVRQQRDELIKQYRALAERQIVIREDALKLSGVEKLNRRQLVEARRLGAQEDEIQNSLEELQAQSQELVESIMFSHVHDRIEGWLRYISDELTNGTVDIEVTDRQQFVADSIGRIIEALEEANAPPDEFAQDEQAGGGAGSQGQQGEQQLIPSIAELRLLRSVQEQVYNQTTVLDSRDDLTEAQHRNRLRDLGQEQRDLYDLGQQIVESLQQQPPTP